jgi:L-glyceraldehyde 3-phosphate reductase
MGALDLIVRQGKALYIGISNYSAEQTRKASDILKKLGTPCLIHQPSYSIFNRWIEDGLQDVLKEEGIGSIVFSPLAGGLLTNRYLNGIPSDSRAAGRSLSLKPESLTEEKLEKIKRLDKLAQRRGQTLAQMSIAWVLRGGRVTSALVGASKVSQLEDTAAVLSKLDFSSGELAEIDEITK